MPDRLEATVHGVVQGVGYRWYVMRRARHLELVGWAANQPDGTVRVVAEGPGAALDELARELENGPPGAAVRSVDVERLAATGAFTRFEIRAAGHSGD